MRKLINRLKPNWATISKWVFTLDLVLILICLFAIDFRIAGIFLASLSLLLANVFKLIPWGKPLATGLLLVFPIMAYLSLSSVLPTYEHGVQDVSLEHPLTIFGSPQKATIYLNDEEVGSPRSIKLEEGIYDLRIEYPGYMAWKERVQIPGRQIIVYELQDADNRFTFKP